MSGLWTVPTTLASLSGNQPVALLDSNFEALAIMSQYASAASGTNAISITVPLSFAAYVSGMRFGFIAPTTNTSSMTLNVNGKGAVAIQYQGTAVGAGITLSGDYYEVMYDGSVFRLLNPNLNFNCLVIAYLTANMAIADDTITEVGSGAATFTEVIDTGGNFTASSGRFQAPATGIYQFDFQASLDALTASKTLYFTSFIADTAFTAGTICFSGSSTNNASDTSNSTIVTVGGGLVSLTSGAVRSLYVWHRGPSGSARTLEGGFEDTTKISIRRVA